MTQIIIENINDINITDYGCIRIDFEPARGSATRLELSREDTVLLKLRLNEINV